MAKQRTTRWSRQAGFNLLELMVVVGIVAILIGIAVPSFKALVNSNRLTAQANEFVTAIQFARAEAVRGNHRATFCQSSASGTADCAATSNPAVWVVKTKGASEAGGAVVREFTLNPVLNVTMDASLGSGIEFGSDGLAHNSTGTLETGNFTICSDASKDNNRVVAVAAGGRVSVSENTDYSVCTTGATP